MADQLIRGSDSLTQKGTRHEILQSAAQILLRDHPHANSTHVCVVDHAGIKHLHQNFNTKPPERFLIALQPFSSHDLIIGCESTFMPGVTHLGKNCVGSSEACQVQLESLAEFESKKERDRYAGMLAVLEVHVFSVEARCGPAVNSRTHFRTETDTLTGSRSAGIYSSEGNQTQF